MTFKKEWRQWATWGALGVAIVVAVVFWNLRASGPGKLDGFAQCLGEKGAAFYGAFWCPHCHNQKELFGSSQKYLPYKECSTPDGNSQLAECTEKKIDGYPTWIFKDGSRMTGEVSLEDLAKKTSCPLPQ